MSVFVRRGGEWVAATEWERVNGEWVGSGAPATLLEAMLADDPLGLYVDNTGADQSGNDLDLTPFGSPTAGVSLDASDPDGASVTFNGSNNLWNPEKYADFDLVDALSLSFSFNATAVGTSVRELFRKDVYFGTFIGTDSKLHASVRRGGIDSTITGTTTILVNTTYYGALTFDGTTLRLYLNGAEEGNVAVAAPLDADNSQSLTLGLAGTGGAVGITGRIGKAGIYDHALSAGRVAAHYAAGT